MPIFLVLTAVRLLLTPQFLHIEYNMPAFPEDPYGFTKNERLYWSSIALEYLVNDADISFLGDLRFEDGNSVYNERELRHMVDVKMVVKNALTLWYSIMIILGVLGLWSWYRKNWHLYIQGLARGGLYTVVLLVAVILFVLIGFGIFFVVFHQIFFEDGTWTFLYSDTLIRLFPERFWRDTFLWVGLSAILLGTLINRLFQQKRN